MKQLQTDEWIDLARCDGMDTKLFFDKYEEDPELAKKIDNVCLSCPAIKYCFEKGTSDLSWGVWGGIYLVDGRPDSMRNAHKTSEVWNQILDGVKTNG
jgi:hypothetical protein